jgi:phosphohistidine phosphatase
MSRTLILTRHAKSSWSDSGIDDFDRPLNGRGRISAPAIGGWLAAKGHVPGEVIVSGARRTVDTWAGIAPRLPVVAQMRSSPAIYHGSADTMLSVLRGASAPVTLLIGHNPGLAEFAQRIVRAPHDHPRFADFPTCATAVIRFETDDWAAIGWGEGEVVDFVVPRELPEE